MMLQCLCLFEYRMSYEGYSGVETECAELIQTPTIYNYYVS